MKKLFLIFLLASSAVSAQNTDAIVDKLITNGLITQADKKFVGGYLSGKKSNSNSSIINALAALNYEQTFNRKAPESLRLALMLNSFRVDEKDRLDLNRSLEAYLVKLHKYGLVTDRQYQALNDRINSNTYNHQLELLSVIQEQADRQAVMEPQNIMPLIEKFKQNSIVTTNYEQLVKDINAKKLESPIELLNYFDRTVKINGADYPKEPEKFLEPIHKETMRVLPELAFTNFKFEIVDDGKEVMRNDIQYDFICSIDSHGRTYKQRSFYRLYFAESKHYSESEIDHQEYYKIFNKILADIQSPYRLHHLVETGTSVLAEGTFIIIALTSEQEEILKKTGLGFFLIPEDYSNSTTTVQIEKLISEYQQIGLLKHLTEQQIATGRKNVEQQGNGSVNDVLAGFADIIYSFDMEMGNLQDPYTEITREVSKISHGQFDPTEISDDFDIDRKKQVTIKFTLKGSLYQTKIDINDDWVNPEFFEFINKAARESKLTGQFYFLDGETQVARAIFLTPGQYNRLRTNNLLKFLE
ncbi:MAG TPA: hypothetical protein VFE50_12720 [Cyclobacteriaceae bacterium]|nr:hypothetical protein [Cyclobacteriaceae bacterium]